MLKRSSPFLLCLLLLLYPLLSPSTVRAQIFWSTPAKINTSSDLATFPSIATGPNNYLHSAWMEFSAGNENWGGYQNPGIFYSVWNGDAWSAATKISQNTGFAELPSLTVSPNSDVHVVWDEDSANPANSWGRILYSKYSSGSWSSPISLSQTLDLEGSWAWDAEIVSDSTNNLHVIFTYTPPNMGWARLYYLKWNGTSWSTPERLTVKNSDQDNLQSSTLAVDAANNPHLLLWEQGTGSADPDRGIYHTYHNGTSWSSPTKLTSEGENPKFTISADNNRHVVWGVSWYDAVAEDWKNRVDYVQWNGSTWSSPYTITSQATYSYWGNFISGVTYDTSNNVYVGWGEQVGWGGLSNKGIQVSYRKWTSSTSLWSSPIFMRLAYDLDNPFLYKDKWDNQHLVWAEQNQTNNLWEVWYSTIPINVNNYIPGSQLVITLANTIGGGDTLTLPSGALSVPATISAQIGPLPASASPAVTTIPRSFTFRPHGLQFAQNKPATAVINYTDAEMINTDERNLKVYIWDGQANSWSSSFDTAVNRTQNKATVTLPHFSLYGLFLPTVQTSWLEPVGQSRSFRSGSTIPLRFKMGYHPEIDSAWVFDPATDVKLLIYNPAGEKIKEFTMDTGGENLRYDLGNRQFLANFKTQGLTTGDYKLQTTLADNPVGELVLSLRK